MPAKADTTAKKAMKAGMAALLAICEDTEAKPADRIAAAKALLDYASRQSAPEDAGTLRVILDNVPKEYIT